MKSVQTSLIQKGFTLIELLVVIGILGILATALVATIDPFEQLKKAQDSNIKNALVEYLNANLRYYTTHNAMPWASTTNGGYNGCGDTNEEISGKDLNTSPGKECMQALIDDGELKSTFGDATNITKEIFVKGSKTQVTACYMPQSKSQKRDPQTKFNVDGTAKTGCLADTTNGSDDCYWCAVL